jgi:hypothetical protein
MLNAAMANEVTALAELSALKRAAGVRSARRFSAEELVNEKVTAE